MVVNSREKKEFLIKWEIPFGLLYVDLNFTAPKVLQFQFDRPQLTFLVLRSL